MPSQLLPDLPNINLVFPSSPLADAALLYAKQYTSETVWQHTVRSAYFAVILWRKLPQFRGVDIAAVIISCILHDLGWSTVEGYGNGHMRFEVDGAELAREWVRSRGVDGDEHLEWNEGRQQLLWDSIALHTSPDFALYKEPEVALTHMAIMTDFGADKTPGGAVTREEFQEVVRAFPRVDFGVEGFKKIMCGLCERKPEATFTTFVEDFGQRFGYDGEGGGREDYQEKRNKLSRLDLALGSLEYSDALAKEVEAGEKAAVC